MTVRLPIARMGPGTQWFVEGDGYVMRLVANVRDLTIAEARRICVVAAGALRDDDAAAAPAAERA